MSDWQSTREKVTATVWGTDHVSRLLDALAESHNFAAYVQKYLAITYPLAVRPDGEAFGHVVFPTRARNAEVRPL